MDRIGGVLEARIEVLLEDILEEMKEINRRLQALEGK
jgi:hypothetical protein